MSSSEEGDSLLTLDTDEGSEDGVLDGGYEDGLLDGR